MQQERTFDGRARLFQNTFYSRPNTLSKCVYHRKKKTSILCILCIKILSFLIFTNFKWKTVLKLLLTSKPSWYRKIQIKIWEKKILKQKFFESNPILTKIIQLLPLKKPSNHSLIFSALWGAFLPHCNNGSERESIAACLKAN